MSDRERIKALEARVAELERQLVAARGAGWHYPYYANSGIPVNCTLVETPDFLLRGPVVQYTGGLGNTGYVMPASCTPTPETDRDRAPLGPFVTTYPPR